MRIIAALNEAPVELINQGKMRADLFYRLSVGMLTLPPLSKRPEDIPLLANYFIDKYRNDVAQDIFGLSESARLTLMSHDWPGNVRILENATVRSMIMQEQDGMLAKIIFEEEGLDLQSHASPAPPPSAASTEAFHGSLEQQVAQFEKGLIESALDSFQGNSAAAARSLNISRTTLQYKVQKYAIRFGVVKD